MAHRKAGGTTRLGRDSQGQRLGVKRFGGHLVSTGEIVLRQRGAGFHPGPGVSRARNFDLYAVRDGTVSFYVKKVVSFTGRKVQRRFVAVLPSETKI